MNEFPNPKDEAAPSFFERVESMEPYVAIRFLILQIALAVAVGFTASRELETRPPGLENLADPGTLFAMDQIAKFGYPIRELVWSGDWWRIPAGFFLPPQWMLWGIACVGMFPFARYLEIRIGRFRSLGVYLIGSACIVFLDLLSFTGVTSGALGMVMATGGAAWVLLRFEGFRILTSGLEIPGVAWFLLFLIVPISYIHTSLHFTVDSTTATVTPLVPSWIALMAAAITGMVCVLPLAVRRMHLLADEGAPKPSLWYPNFARIVACFWGVTVASYGGASWFADHKTDHQIWKVEPQIQSGNLKPLAGKGGLIENHPGNLFLKKRLAVHHLRNEEWEIAKAVLTAMLEDATDTLRYRQRLANLNLRDSGMWDSWRYSGISSNYDTSRERILLDLAQLSRLSGDEESLVEYRGQVLEGYLDLAERGMGEIEKTVEENEALREKEPTPEEEYRSNRLQAQKLNATAYMAAELGGDLSVAHEEATKAVKLMNDPMLLDTLGWIEILMGNNEEGIRLIEDALFSPRLSPSGTIHYHLAVGHENLGHLSRAREIYLKALSLDLEWWEEVDIRRRCATCFESGPLF